MEKHLFKSLFVLLALLPATVFAQVSMTIDAKKRGPLTSKYQYGLFFEEINHAGDGGLYAELIRNRSFEDAATPAYWSAVGGATISLTTDNLLNSAQGKALKVVANAASATSLKGVVNAGYWGMKFEKDSIYTLSFYVKADKSSDAIATGEGKLIAQLQGADGSLCGEAVIEGTVGTEWTKLTAKIKAVNSAEKGKCALLSKASGTFYLDVVSLFPYTWKGRENGLRPDLAELLAATKPTFLRFPGGCYVEGEETMETAFQWKQTLGPIETRPGHESNTWKYRSTDGLGFHEYLQMCEDLECAPMYVVNIGLGHQFVVPMEYLDTLVQNTMDALEYANGDVTTYWGALRAKNGHPEPFNIKFVEIGNENYQANANERSQNYAERYYAFYKAIKEKYPEIVCIGNVEAWGTDNPSWRNNYPVDLVDEHYYRTFDWMTSKYNKYDTYDRAISVYVGEYAANTGDYGKYGNMNSALGEAIFALGMEKNSDVCKMSSFAPIFTHESDPCWPYDMIHFNSAKTFCTPSYYVQKLLAQNTGHQNLLWEETNNVVSSPDTKYRVGVATWGTKVNYDNVLLVDGEGNTLIDDDFSSDSGLWDFSGGTWKVTLGALKQSTTNNDCRAINKTDFTASNYTLSLTATKASGSEGFLVVFNYKDEKNYCWWNIGGWNNAQHGVEMCKDGVKSTLVSAAGKVNSNQAYKIRIEVKGDNVKCYLNEKLIHDFNLPGGKAVFQCVQLNEAENELILKVVNPNETAQTINLDLKNMKATGGKVLIFSAAKGTDENTMDEPEKVVPAADYVAISDVEKLDIPANSFCIFRLDVKEVAEEEKSPTRLYADEDADKFGYLFAHMNSTQEITNYALSKYGKYWEDLLGSQEVFSTKDYTNTGGMRDAFVYRLGGDNGEVGSRKKFMLCGTDMTSRLGWDSNFQMNFLLSHDLVHWYKRMNINLRSNEVANHLGIRADYITAAWAPEVIYAPELKQYMIYFSLGVKGDRHRIYYSLVDEDLMSFTMPELLFDPGHDVIDADIVWNAVDQQYVMYYKHEVEKTLYQATAKYLVPQEADLSQGTRQWKTVEGFNINDGNAIEGSSLFRPIGSNKWRVAWQNYGSNPHVYKFADLDEHCLNKGAATAIAGNVQAQHGSFLKLTEAEYNYLLTWEQVKTLISEAETYYEMTGSEDIKTAIDLANNALVIDGNLTFEDYLAKMNAAYNALKGVNSIYLEWLKAQASNGKEMDLTPLIKNADFAKGGASWKSSPVFTAANGFVAEYFNTKFDFSQTIEGLPAGDYKVGVQAFFRCGDKNNALIDHYKGTEVLHAKLYANSNEKTVVSLYSEDRYTDSPYNYPDNMTQADLAFNTYDLYHNAVRVTITDGEPLTIGMRATGLIATQWCCFDNFTLRFLGNSSGIEAVHSTESGVNSAYNLAGQKVSPDYRGIIIRNGKKILKH